MNTPTSESTSAAAADSVTSSPSSSSLSSSTRTGKIARLPKVVRDHLNQRICDGVPGTELVRWLNKLPEVREVLHEQFRGQAITEQNLSAWKQGGYVDWLAHEERREWVRRMGEEAEDLEDDVGMMPLMERIGTMMEISLGQAVEKMMSKPLETVEDVRRLLDLSKEVARHRKLALVATKARDQRKEWLAKVEMGLALRQKTLEDVADLLERAKEVRGSRFSAGHGEADGADDGVVEDGSDGSEGVDATLDGTHGSDGANGPDLGESREIQVNANPAPNPNPGYWERRAAKRKMGLWGSLVAGVKAGTGTVDDG